MKAPNEPVCGRLGDAETYSKAILYRPELLYSNGRFLPANGLLVSEDGRVLSLVADLNFPATQIIDLPGKALLPGFVNSHSHSFQRLIRGKAESRVISGPDFWSWRNMMYHAGGTLSPEDIYDVARMAFLEMAYTGTTTVGEFHYLHNAPDGRPYDDPNLLSKQIISAAQSVGIRIVLLRSAYIRSGYELPVDQGQTRFFESRVAFLDNMQALLADPVARLSTVRLGVAPHSVRAVPVEDLREIAAWARKNSLPLHIHVSEQAAENTACIREHGCSPLELLKREKILGPDLTAVHAIHISMEEIEALAEANATICCCPTTERNLGDGIVAADQISRAGVRIALGSDSQAQIDPLEDARQLDYHLRLHHQERAILDQIESKDLAQRLFEAATMNGARTLAVSAGELNPGFFADFFTIDLNEISIVGNSADDLLPMIVFSLSHSAISDVAVHGKFVIRDQRHGQREEIISRYQKVYKKVWRNGPMEDRKR